MATKRKYQRITLLFFFVLFSSLAIAQTSHYFVYLKDKSNSPYSISNPSPYLSPRSIERRAKQGIAVKESDLPVNPAYIDSLKAKGVTVLYTSRWLNAALIEASEAQMELVNSSSVVKNFSAVNRVGAVERKVKKAAKSVEYNPPTTLSLFGNSYAQANMIGVDEMYTDKINGHGLQIAVLDEGFLNADKHHVFDSLFQHNRILATRDFVSGDYSVYEDGEHGTNVLSVLAGFAPPKLIGPAYGAEFYLLRTENSDSEYPNEEVNWLLGAEFADSAGADIISSSVGYNIFDNPAYDHTYSQLNGNTTIITRAADYAAASGMVVVNSAGNEALNDWGYICAPADADSILAIGAVDFRGRHAEFSSFGPSADGRIKPDLAGPGVNVIVATANGSYDLSQGTSFACPIIAGLAAGLWQAFPHLTNMQIIEALKKSASHYFTPDNLVGYGIPDYTRAKMVIAGADLSKASYMLYPNPAAEEVYFIADKAVLGKTVAVKVFDSMGRLVTETVVQSPETFNILEINLPTFPPGLYLLNFVSDTQKVTLKLIKGQ